ncbi:MAG: hypothetical protein ACKPBU_12895, partial [Alphaproteobacteria bacterium]
MNPMQPAKTDAPRTRRGSRQRTTAHDARHTRRARAVHAFVVLATILFPAARARAVAPADLCKGDPCIVAGSWTLPAGTHLDFGTSTSLRLKAGTTILVGAAAGVRTLELLAGSIVLEPGARIVGSGDDAVILLGARTGDVEVQAAGTTVARILADSAASATQAGSAGSISIEASGGVNIAGLLDASASGEDAVAGAIDIVAVGAVSVTRDLAFGATGPGSWGGGLS